MENFARNQEQIRGYLEQTFGRFFPVNQVEEMTREHGAVPARDQRGGRASAKPKSGPEGQPSDVERPGSAQPERGGHLDDEMRELRDRVESLQRRLDALQPGPERVG